MTLQMHAYFIENIVLFIPFGLLFPLVFKNWMRWFTIPVGAFISAAIEYTQLVTGRGYCQLDDFVTNTAGAAIGFFIYLILYAPMQVKQAVTGYGKAVKKQVQEMTRMLLSLPAVPKPDDTADALAMAITFCHTNGNQLNRFTRRVAGPI